MTRATRLDLISGLALGVLVTMVLALYSSHQLFARHPATMAVQGAAVLLMLWARATFGLRSFHGTATVTDGGLVTNGPYRFWRHPIYAAILYALAAGVLTHHTLRGLLLFAVAAAATGVRIACEEAALRDTFGDAYAAYAARTRRLVPYVF